MRIILLLILATFAGSVDRELRVTYLPSRPLHQVDIQNNLRPSTETRQGCEAAGGLVETVPYTKLFLLCAR